MNKYILFCCFILVCGCQSEPKHDKMYRVFQQYITQIGLSFSQVKVVYWASRHACDECVSKAFQFANENQKPTGLLVIGSHFINKKDVRLGFNKEIVKIPCAHFDFKKDFQKFKDIDNMTLYACIINHKLKKIEKLPINPTTQAKVHSTIHLKLHEKL